MLTILYVLAAPLAPRWAIAGLLVVAGGAIEIAQGQVGRNAEWGDWLADIAGIACATLPVWLEALRRRMRA